MSISSPWQGKNHLRSLGEHVRKQSLIISHPRKKGEHSNKLPRHKTLIPGTDEPRVLPLIFRLHDPHHLSVSLISTSQSTHLPHGSKKSKPRPCFSSAIHAGAISSPNSPAANYKSTYPPG